MPTPRFTVRRAMVVVAAIALACGAWREGNRLLRLRHEYAWQEAIHEELAERSAEAAQIPEEQWRAVVLRVAGIMRLGRQGDGIAEALELMSAPPSVQAKLARYHEAMHAKYRRAMWQPWWPVEPDPPAPRWDRKWVP